jgi:hypothetical protein
MFVDVVGDVQAHTTRAYLRTSGDLTFASQPVPIDEGEFDFRLDKQIEPAAEARYWWALVQKHETAMILSWVPNYDKFEQLVTGGLFPGRLEDSSERYVSSKPILGHLEPEHYELLESEEMTTAFLWWIPLVLTRVTE